MAHGGHAHETKPVDNDPHGVIQGLVKQRLLKVTDRTKAQGYEVQGYEFAGR